MSACEFDQSPYVTNSIRGLVLEGLLGAALTGLMVLIFLRDWRSALIVVLNIPFALLGAVVLLWATGQTINIMTLGGLALAVGVLVDEATVEIENIHTQMLPGVSRARAVVEACSRTAMARLLSMFCILAVFVPSFFMVGRGPPAVRAAFAGGGVFHDRVLPAFEHAGAGLLHLADARGASRRRAAGSSALRLLRKLSGARAALALAAGAASTWRPAIGLLYLLLPRMGTEMFPESRTPPLFRIRLRAPAGTRIEETERIVLHALDVIGREAGPDNIEITSDFVGVVPSSYPVDLIHLFTSGPQEAIIQVALKPGAPRGEALRERLRESLAPRVARHARSPSKPATSSAR